MSPLIVTEESHYHHAEGKKPDTKVWREDAIYRKLEEVQANPRQQRTNQWLLRKESKVQIWRYKTLDNEMNFDEEGHVHCLVCGCEFTVMCQSLNFKIAYISQ